MSCWLVLQTDVTSVTFIPAGIEYRIKIDTMESEFQKYLEDRNEEVQKKKNVGGIIRDRGRRI